MSRPVGTRSNRLCRCFMTMMWPRSTLIRPDGEKKTHVQLAPFYDSLDIANKIGIIWVQLTKYKFFTIKKKVTIMVTPSHKLCTLWICHSHPYHEIESSFLSVESRLTLRFTHNQEEIVKSSVVWLSSPRPKRPWSFYLIFLRCLV